MGQSQGVQVSADELARGSHLSVEEVNDLLAEFQKVSPKLQPIEQKKFNKLCERMAAKYPDSVYADPTWRGLLFKYSDQDQSAKVDVQEAISALSVMTKGTNEEKARLCFTSFDKNGDKVLSKSEVKAGFIVVFGHVKALIEEAIKECKKEAKSAGVPGFLVSMMFAAFDPKMIWDLWVTATVDEFFQDTDADGNGTITFEEFVAAAARASPSSPMGLLLNPTSEEAQAKMASAVPSMPTS